MTEQYNLNKNEVYALALELKDTVSLNVPVGDDEDSTLGDFVEDPYSIEEDFNKRLFLDEFRHAVFDEGILSEREANIIKYRFGFVDGKIYTLEEVGEMYGVTRERIRQIEARVIRTLRRKCRKYSSEKIEATVEEESPSKSRYRGPQYDYASPYKAIGGYTKKLNR